MSSFKTALFTKGSVSEIREVGQNLDINSYVLSDFDGVLFEDLVPEEFKKTASLVKGMDIACYWSHIGNFQFDDEEAFLADIDKLKVIAKICGLLKIKYVVVDGIKVSGDSSYYFDVVCEKYRGFVRAIEKSGITLLIHAQKDTCLSDAGKMLDLIKQVNGIKVLYDAAGHLLCNEVPMASYRHLKQYIAMFLASDVDELHVNTIIGTGESNIANIIRMGNKDKFEGYVILDPNLNQYENRNKLYKKSKIPFVNFFMMKNKELKSIKKIDKLLKAKPKDDINMDDIYRLQVMALKKIIERATRE